MAFEKLTQQEQKLIRQAMNAILDGPFIDDAEFQTRLGIDRPQLQKVLSAWPLLNDTDDSGDVCLAINNCINEILYGVYVGAKDWAFWFTAPKEDVEAAYKRWGALKGYRTVGIR